MGLLCILVDSIPPEVAAPCTNQSCAPPGDRAAAAEAVDQHDDLPSPGGQVAVHSGRPRVRVRPQVPGPVSGVTTRSDRPAYNGPMSTPRPSSEVP
jgi:hypothetical protein